MKIRDLLAVLVLTVTQFAFGSSFPWRETHLENLRIIENFDLETDVRTALIHSARESIDVVDFDIGSDSDIALPFIEDLNAATHRGVTVRFVRGGYSAKLYRQLYREPHWTDPVEKLITKSNLNNPIQYIFFGGWKMMLLSGWSPLAAVHEKLIIIDRKVAILSGRNLSKMYSRYIDSTTLFKGPLIHDALHAFENLWETIHDEMWKEIPEEYPEIELPPEGPSLSFTSRRNSKSHQKKLWATLHWAQDPPVEVSSKDPPIRARLLHHDVIQQLRMNCAGIPWVYGWTKCSKQIEDPVVQEIADLLNQDASEMKLYTLGLALNPTLKKALLRRLRTRKAREFSLDLFTNGKNAYQEFVFWPISTLGWKIALPDIDDLLQQGATIRAFTPKKNDPKTFLHHKGAWLKMLDGRQYTFLGSHNLNRASSNVTDEMMIEVESTQMGETFQKYYDHSSENYSQTLDADEIHDQRWWNRLPVLGFESRFLAWTLETLEGGL